MRWIVQRCLAKEPRSRYASTEDLARDLATIRENLSEATSGMLTSAEAFPVRGGVDWLSRPVDRRGSC